MENIVGIKCQKKVFIVIKQNFEIGTKNIYNSVNVNSLINMTSFFLSILTVINVPSYESVNRMFHAK